MAECWKSLQQPITGFRPRQSRVLVQSFPLRFSIRKTDAKPNVSGFASGRKRSGVTKLSHKSVEARDTELVLTPRALWPGKSTLETNQMTSSSQAASGPDYRGVSRGARHW